MTALGRFLLLPGGRGQGITGGKLGDSKGQNAEHPRILARTHRAPYLPRPQLPPGPPTPGAGSLPKVLDAGLCQGRAARGRRAAPEGLLPALPRRRGHAVLQASVLPVQKPGVFPAASQPLDAPQTPHPTPGPCVSGPFLGRGGIVQAKGEGEGACCMEHLIKKHSHCCFCPREHGCSGFFFFALLSSLRDLSSPTRD